MFPVSYGELFSLQAVKEKLERYRFRLKDPGQTMPVMWGKNLEIVEADASHSALQLDPTKQV